MIRRTSFSSVSTHCVPTASPPTAIDATRSPLDRLAAEGVRFDQTVSASNWTAPAFASILTGLPVGRHGVRNGDLAMSGKVETLAERLRAGGWRTHAVLYKAFLFGLGLEQGFDRWFNLPTSRRTAQVNLDKALTWLDRHHDRRFFLFLHLDDPHQPFNQPQPFDSRFGDARALEELAIELPISIRGSRVDGCPGCVGERGARPEFLPVAQALYDGEVAYTDDRIGVLLERLREHGIYDDTVVAVVSDHGEVIYDRQGPPPLAVANVSGGWGHGSARLVDELVRVPMILKPARGRRVEPGRVVREQVRVTDLMPTILEAVGLTSEPSPGGGVDSQSLWPLIDGREKGDRVAFVENPRRSVVGLRTRDWKFAVHSRGGAQPLNELYDLRADPEEKINVASRHPGELARLGDALASYLLRTRPGPFLLALGDGGGGSYRLVLEGGDAAPGFSVAGIPTAGRSPSSADFGPRSGRRGRTGRQGSGAGRARSTPQSGRSRLAAERRQDARQPDVDPWRSSGVGPGHARATGRSPRAGALFSVRRAADRCRSRGRDDQPRSARGPQSSRLHRVESCPGTGCSFRAGMPMIARQLARQLARIARPGKLAARPCLGHLPSRRLRAMQNHVAPLLLAAVAFASCVGDNPEVRGAGDPADRITAEGILADVEVLSADDMEGRAAGTPGAARAAAYISDRFEQIGLEPMGESYLLPVELVGLKKDGDKSSLEIGGPQGALPLENDVNFTFWSTAEKPVVDLADVPIVFVGYGVQAPEHDWDDLEGEDVRGKVLLFLNNDPQVEEDGEELFGGEARTYYGRWTYKFEQAEKLGAAGAIVVHTLESASYPFSVIGNTGSRRIWQRTYKLDLLGWADSEITSRIASSMGTTVPGLFEMANRREFRPVDTGYRVTAHVETAIERVEDANVVGVVRGQDPDLADEYLVFTAHYDHLGVIPSRRGRRQDLQRCAGQRPGCLGHDGSGRGRGRGVAPAFDDLHRHHGGGGRAPRQRCLRAQSTGAPASDRRQPQHRLPAIVRPHP